VITTSKKKINKKRTAPQSQPAIAAVAEPAPRKVKTIKLGVDVQKVNMGSSGEGKSATPDAL
jgi:hypothetical protein